MTRSKLLFVALTVLVIVGCATQETATPQTIKIGQLASLTSFGATFGNDERQGVQLAVEEINAKGGINGKQLEVVLEDIQTDQAVTVTAYQKLVAVDGVHYIIGPTWGTFVPGIIGELEADSVVLISPSAGEELEVYRNPHFFKTWPADKLETSILILHMEQKKISRIATVTSNGQFSTAMKEGFLDMLAGHDITVVSEHTVQSGESDFRTIIEKLKQENVQAVYLVQEGFSDAGEFLKQSQNLGFTVPVYGWSGIDNNPDLKENYAAYMERVIYPLPQQTGRDAAFNAKFKTRFGEEPQTPVAATAYDATMVLAEALRKGTDVASVRAAIQATSTYEGASSFRGFQSDVGWPKSDRMYITKTMHNGQYVETT